MCEFAVADPVVSAFMAKERHEQAMQDFSGITQSSNNTTADSDSYDWMQKLQLNPKAGTVKSTIDNIIIILDNDPLLKGKFALNQFAGRAG